MPKLPCPKEKYCKETLDKDTAIRPSAWVCCKEDEYCSLYCMKKSTTPTPTTTSTTTTSTQIEWTMIYNYTVTMTTSSIKQERSNEDESDRSGYDSDMATGDYREYSGENYDWDKEILKETEMWAN